MLERMDENCISFSSSSFFGEGGFEIISLVFWGGGRKIRPNLDAERGEREREIERGTGKRLQTGQ